MNSQKAKAQQMRFLFITNTNTFATYACRLPLRSLAIVLSSLMLVIESCILYIIYNFLLPEITNYQITLTIMWLLMLAGPISQNFYLCYILTYILEIATILEFAFKGNIIYVMLWPLDSHTAPVFYGFVVYFIIRFIAAYVCYAYTKSLGLGLLRKEESQGNFQCIQFIQSSDSDCQVPANTNLRVERSPTILHTNPANVTLTTYKQGVVVNNAICPLI
jgi:hypothetical protein